MSLTGDPESFLSGPTPAELEQFKIDSDATNGLLGIKDSLAYRIAEIERHLHSAGSWFGVAASPSATNIADRVGPGIAAFQIESGDDDWGAWVQILGSADTPTRGESVYFDPHSMQVTTASDNVTFFIQIGRGASGAAALLAGTYSELVVTADAANKVAAVPLKVQTGRAPAGSLVWARCMSPSADAKTVDFYLGIHEYEG